MSCARWFCALIIFNVMVVLQSSRTWETRQVFPASKIPDNALNPKRSIVRRKIVLYHNFFRTKVQPPASNMLMMSWHPLAAKQAQQYADKCIYLQHNDPKENTVPPLGTCGQNLFVASQKTPWFFALKNWFLEYQNFTYGTPVRDIKAVGHYTQMVWATSHKVGCGIAHCAGGPWGQFYNYVCHYCPAGNFDPYTEYPYKVGKPCQDCPHNCVADNLCTNSCFHKDQFSNCDEIIGVSGRNAICSQGICNATCECANKKIHRNYPWK
ncbi:hypothetical protein ABMA28_013584 [Loxostege sticticalis]|uniref:SCP domain-containing protein n=1 Tax=Loxostege sticticalis TaxID=481309 RepID=A0ABD0TIT9_LOXSC